MMWEWKMLAPPAAMLGVFRIVRGNRSWIRHMRTASLFMLMVLTVSALSCGDMGTSLSKGDMGTSLSRFVWVGKIFIGGRQCTNDVYIPPDTRRLLSEAGIVVFATYVVHHATCAACGCPTYAAMHAALIDARQLREAEALGFSLIEPPVRSSEAMKEGRQEP